MRLDITQNALRYKYLYTYALVFGTSLSTQFSLENERFALPCLLTPENNVCQW